jgi:hypothetical protein
LSYFHLGRDHDEPPHLREERYLIARKAGRFNRPAKLNDEYQISPKQPTR